MKCSTTNGDMGLVELDLSCVDVDHLDDQAVVAEAGIAERLPPSESIAWDIETGALPADELAAMMDPFPDPEPFDDASVKLGNLKDEAKIAQKIADAREKHAAEWRRKRLQYEQNFLAKAPLDPMRGQVLAIGYGTHDGRRLIHAAEEADLLIEFWSLYRRVAHAGGQLVGWNIHKFDLPFLRLRSFRHELEVPPEVLKRGGRYWHECFVDLMTEWVCGGGYQSLDRVAQFLRVGAKNGDAADFQRLWEEDREQAIRYLSNDIHMTAAVARRMGH